MNSHLSFDGGQNWKDFSITSTPQDIDVRDIVVADSLNWVVAAREDYVAFLILSTTVPAVSHP